MAGEQTEKATPKRRQRAANEGDRLVSRELISACAFLAGIVALGASASHWIAAWREGYAQGLDLAMPASGLLPEPWQVAARVRSISIGIVSPLLMVGFAASGAALAAGLLQGGGQFTTAAIAPKWGRLSPGANIGRLFSQQSLVRLLKSALPVVAIAWLAWGKLAALAVFPILSLARLPAMFTAVYELLFDAAVIMLVWSALDFGSSWWAREKRLRMTKQDVKDEFKESEGNPQAKRKIRALQRQVRSQTRGRKLKADVAKATVVVTNPTHYAVALSFDFETMEPPRVLAKGRDLWAERIKEEARWAGVPIVENPPLARSLYKNVEEGQNIPFELYAAVAGILAYLYRREVEERMRARAAAAGAGGPGFAANPLTARPSAGLPPASRDPLLGRDGPGRASP